MEPIIQTLVLAAVLLIIGLVCIVIGITGLVWAATRNKRRAETPSDDVEFARSRVTNGRIRR